MMSKSRTIGMAVIGFGAMHNFGWMHSTWIKACSNAALIGICDQSPERREAARAAFPGCRVYASTAEIWADDEVEAVSIVTPNFTHCPLACEAFAHGRHVLCENALGLNAAECDRMVQAAEAAGKSLCVNHNRRHDGNYRAIREIVDRGLIGDIFQIELSPAWYMNPFPNATPELWWADKNRSGGLFFYYGSQAFDWIIDLIPEPVVSVMGYAQKRRWHNITNEDQVTAIIQFANGAVANFTESYIDASGKPFWRILGSKGAIVDWKGAMIPGYQKQIAAPSCGELEVRLGAADGTVKVEKFAYKDSDWNRFYSDWAEHLIAGTPNPMDGRVGRRVLALVDAAKRSIAENCAVTPEFNSNLH